jgi:endothelin-converting enzyme/putative endopeptidase
VNRFLVLGVLAPAAALAQYTGFGVANMDKAVNPCTDFYQYACGTWMKNNAIPADQSRWGRFDELQERNQVILRDILETASGKKSGRSAVEQKIGDYYSSCMDEKAIEAKGIEPLEPMLKRIAAVKDKKELPALIIELEKLGTSTLFGMGAAPDYKNSKMVIVHAAEGGTTMPDRDYYLKTDPKSVSLREKYTAHVARMLELLGEPKEKAEANAKAILALETRAAEAQMDRVTRRNPLKRYHPMTIAELQSLTPSFDFSGYIGGMGAPTFDRLNVMNPEFFKALEKTLAATSLDDIKTFFRWRYLHANAEMLPSAFVKENFEFFGKTLTGAKELRPRWKRCVAAVNSDLGEALGQKYVEVAFGPQAKQRMAELIKNLEGALEKDIHELQWMTPETKKRAFEKLKAIQNKVGYPEKWRDYTKLSIKAGDAYGNSIRSNVFMHYFRIEKVGKAPDPKEWYMTPPTVNAYYSPLENNINFPAGILQPPFFDVKLDDAVNYGGIGAVIGHEITHGFDDQGRRFDASGNMTDWWTPEDGKEYERRAACIDKQYSEYTSVDDVKLNGKLTLGENVADNGGLRIAHMALLAALGGKPVEKIDGFTPEQRMFLGWAQVWCQNVTPEAARLRAQTDPHSPGRWRVNGTVSNMPEFWKAFGCSEGTPMVRGENACRVW